MKLIPMPETDADDGGAMAQDDIEALLNQAASEGAPASETKPEAEAAAGR